MHTKEKWEVRESSGGLYDIYVGEYNICSIYHEKDAKHIVKCVNNFDEMLEALKDIKEQSDKEKAQAIDRFNRRGES